MMKEKDMQTYEDLLDDSMYEPGLREKIEKRLGKPKFFLLLLIVTTFLSAIFFYFYHINHFRFSLEENIFVLESHEGKDWLFKSRENGELINVYYDKDDNVNELSVRYKDNIYLKKYDYDENTYYFYENGQEVERQELIQFSVNEEPKQLPFYQEIIQKVIQVINYENTVSYFVVCFYILLIAAFGALQVAFPEKLWQIRHFLSVDGGEPTSLYLFLSRMSGFIFLGVAVVFPYIALSDMG